MTSLFSRLQKLNKEATEGPWIQGEDNAFGVWRGRWFGLIARTDIGEPNATDAELIVECRNSLPAVLNLIEAAQEATRWMATVDRFSENARDKLEAALAPFMDES